MIIGKKVKTTQMKTVGEWMNKMWYVHTMDIIHAYYSAIKRKEILTHAIAWMNLEHFMRSDRSHAKKITYFMIPFMLKSRRSKSIQTESGIAITERWT